MGKLKIVKCGPLATIQDRGRFGYRRYGFPQSGTIDPYGMNIANELVSNDLKSPVIEFALTGMRLEALSRTIVGVYGASVEVNDVPVREQVVELEKGDLLTLSAPEMVYAYVSIGGKLQADLAYGSYSTYLPGNFGGYQGRSLQIEDQLETVGLGKLSPLAIQVIQPSDIRFVAGPEWEEIKNPFDAQSFSIDPSSNRIGIRLIGDPIASSIQEIKSSAVVPGTIQLLPSGHLVVLMNDCQTTGGYPRIGKVLDEDLGKLGQHRAWSTINLRYQDTF